MRDNLIEIPTKSARMCGIFFASFFKTAVYVYIYVFTYVKHSVCMCCQLSNI